MHEMDEIGPNRGEDVSVLTLYRNWRVIMVDRGKSGCFRAVLRGCVTNVVDLEVTEL